jgi:hypothetical protein
MKTDKMVNAMMQTTWNIGHKYGHTTGEQNYVYAGSEFVAECRNEQIANLVANANDMRFLMKCAISALKAKGCTDKDVACLQKVVNRSEGKE